MAVNKDRKLKIIPLGGLGEIGKNITLLEYNDEIIIIDCGLAFPEDEMLGIDIVIPDISYLIKNQHKIKGLFVTHGHEDHIGAIPYLLKKIPNVPIYGTKLPMGLLANKFIEHNLQETKLNTINHGNKIKAGESFRVHFIRSNHSIPDSSALAIETPLGVVFHTGDFKIDQTPINDMPIDLQTIAEYGKKGVLVAFSDSTNVERPGYTMSEKTVGAKFIDIFKKAKKRIIVATFASNIHRIQQIIDAAAIYNRKVAISGRSMHNTIDIAQKTGFIDIPENILINARDLDKYKDNQIVVISTGSQGEAMAALSRMAANSHRQVKLKKGDMVIFSANPIPGNEKTVGAVINKLYEKEVEVIYEALHDVHVSGHARQEELKLMLNLLNPRFFIPVHGERRHLQLHAELAEEMGIHHNNTIVGYNGDIIEVTDNYIKTTSKVQSGNILVDGLGIGDVGNIVLRDRKNLSENGLIVAVVTIEKKSGKIAAGPDIISRGFVYVRENEDLMEESKKVVQRALDKCIQNKERDWSAIKNSIRQDLNQFIYNEIKRNPMILPIIMEI